MFILILIIVIPINIWVIINTPHKFHPGGYPLSVKCLSDLLSLTALKAEPRSKASRLLPLESLISLQTVSFTVQSQNICTEANDLWPAGSWKPNTGYWRQHFTQLGRIIIQERKLKSNLLLMDCLRHWNKHLQCALRQLAQEFLQLLVST